MKIYIVIKHSGDDDEYETKNFAVYSDEGKANAARDLLQKENDYLREKYCWGELLEIENKLDSSWNYFDSYAINYCVEEHDLL